MSRLDPKSISSLIDRALSGNFLDIATTLDRLQNVSLDVGSKYPPSNLIMLDEHTWLIELAVAGFSSDDLKVTMQKDNVLEVVGNIQAKPEAQAKYIRRGIGLRSFTEQYALAEGAKVAEVKLVNGMLSIRLERDPPKLEEPKVLRITQG